MLIKNTTKTVQVLYSPPLTFQPNEEKEITDETIGKLILSNKNFKEVRKTILDKTTKKSKV